MGKASVLLSKGHWFDSPPSPGGMSNCAWAKSWAPNCPTNLDVSMIGKSNVPRLSKKYLTGPTGS